MELDHHNMKKIGILITFTLVLAWVLQNITQAGQLLGGLIRLISPFLVGLGIAFVLNLILCPMERMWTALWAKKSSRAAERCRRPVCILLSVALFLGVISMIFFVLVPQLESTFRDMAEMLPDMLERLEDWWTEMAVFAAAHNVVLPTVQFDPETVINAVSAFFTANGHSVFGKTLDVTLSIASALMNGVLAFVFSLYVLAQKETLGRNAKRLLYAVIRKKYADRIFHLCTLSMDILGKFVSGQVTEACILGMLCFIGMWILRLPYALVISVVIGFTALVPMFGAWIGAAVGVFLIVFTDPLKAVWFLVFILLLQQIEGNLIYPKVVGSSVGLPGIWVFVAVTVGGSALGIVGMVFSVPLFSVGYALLSEMVNRK